MQVKAVDSFFNKSAPELVPDGQVGIPGFYRGNLFIACDLELKFPVIAQGLNKVDYSHI